MVIEAPPLLLFQIQGEVAGKVVLEGEKAADQVGAKGPIGGVLVVPAIKG